MYVRLVTYWMLFHVLDRFPFSVFWIDGIEDYPGNQYEQKLLYQLEHYAHIRYHSRSKMCSEMRTCDRFGHLESSLQPSEQQDSLRSNKYASFSYHFKHHLHVISLW